MAELVLINGLPGSGKSTVARSLAADRPLSLVLDVDVVRSLLSGWAGAPTASGLLARELALTMCATHLGAGHDVLVPQFVVRPEFVLALEQVARAAVVRFVEVALLVPAERAAERVAQRAAARPGGPEHADAAVGHDREGGPAALVELEHRLLALLDDRTATHRVDAGGAAETVLAAVRERLARE